LDSSDAVNELIRQQFGTVAAPVATLQAPPPAPKPRAPIRIAAPAPATSRAAPLAAAPAVTSGSPLKVQAPAPPAPAEAESASGIPAAPSAERCLKHPDQLATNRCQVCQKLICPKCMALTGYVCSAYCKAQAEQARIEIPIYENQKSVIEAKGWRRVRRVAYSAIFLVAVLASVWGWYAFVGSKPRVVLAVKLPALAHEGECKLVAPDQALLLHGGRLARYDLKARKEVWSASLIDQRQIEADAAKWQGELKEDDVRAKKDLPESGGGREGKIPALDELARELAESAGAELRLHALGQQLWVSAPHKIVRYDWQTGKPTQEVPIKGETVKIVAGESSLLVISTSASGRQILTRVDAASGEPQTLEITSESVGGTGRPFSPRAAGVRTTNSATAAANATRSGRLTANAADLAKLEAKAAQSAAIRVRGNSVSPAPAEQAGESARVAPSFDGSRTEWVAAGEQAVEVSIRLLESKIELRQAMKEPPKQSALEGTVNAAATAGVANEILNEMKRNDEEDVEREDVSRYQVTLKRWLAKDAPDWTGEVIGPPAFFALKTVGVLVAGKSVRVFDPANKKLWESKLNYAIVKGVGPGGDPLAEEGAPAAAPCVERNDALYIFDQGILTAFDLRTGQARWRLPSVGISKLLFDEPGMMYVNTTSDSQDAIKYSQQIDVAKKVWPVILKVDPRSGRILWKTGNRGWVSRITGKFIYATESHPGEDSGMLGMGRGIAAHVRIYRLDLADGTDLWEHYDNRFPLALDFQENTIQILFKKEMQVLKFIAF